MPEWARSEWYVEWLKLAKRDYLGSREELLDYTKIRDSIVIYYDESKYCHNDQSSKISD